VVVGGRTRGAGALAREPQRPPGAHHRGAPVHRGRAMNQERVLEQRPLVLDRRQRERYFEDGFLTVPGYVGTAWLDRLRAVVTPKTEGPRPPTASDDQFALAPDHTAEKPNIRRLRKAVDRHPDLWTFATDPIVVDLVADLLGPDVRFHSSK